MYPPSNINIKVPFDNIVFRKVLGTIKDYKKNNVYLKGFLVQSYKSRANNLKYITKLLLELRKLPSFGALFLGILRAMYI